MNASDSITLKALFIDLWSFRKSWWALTRRYGVRAGIRTAWERIRHWRRQQALWDTPRHISESEFSYPNGFEGLGFPKPNPHDFGSVLR